MIDKMDFSVVQQDLEETPEGEVYFIFRKDKDRKCKIGKSINSKQRVKGLQTGNHHELYIYKTLAGYDRLESMLHNYFQDQRIRKTEWFDITLADVDDVVEAYNGPQEDRQISENGIEEKDNVQEDSETNIIEDVIDEKELIEEVTEETKITKRVYHLKKYVCDKCGKGFSQEKYLKQHEKKLIPCNIKFNCNKCGKIFTRQRDADNHNNRKTSCVPNTNSTIIEQNANRKKCYFCNNTYETRLKLQKHLTKCSMKDNTPLIMQLLEEKNKVIALQQQIIDNQINPTK